MFFGIGQVGGNHLLEVAGVDADDGAVCVIARRYDVAIHGPWIAALRSQ